MVIDPAMDDILTKLKLNVTELYSPYGRGQPSTLNPQLIGNLQRLQIQQLADSQQGLSTEMDADDRVCRELLNLMRAYYDIAI